MKKIMPPTYFFGLLLLLIVLHFTIPIKTIIKTPYNYIGIIFIAFGVVINIMTDNLYKKKQTTVKPHEKPTSFIKSGPFKISRNPMYLGMVSILLGTAIFLKSIIAFVAPILFVILMEIVFIKNEEKNMEKQFGKEFIEYKEKVRKWI